jgi:hypothetical protein
MQWAAQPEESLVFACEHCLTHSALHLPQVWCGGSAARRTGAACIHHIKCRASALQHMIASHTPLSAHMPQVWCGGSAARPTGMACRQPAMHFPSEHIIYCLLID